MIYTIKKSEQDAVAYICIEHGFKHTFYTDEKHDGLCFVDIEAPPELMFYIGRGIEAKLNADYYKQDNLFDLFKVKF